MIFIVGTVGFIAGFVLGIAVIAGFTQNYSNEDLIENKKLHWKYGLIVWFFAVVTSGSSVFLYNEFLM